MAPAEPLSIMKFNPHCASRLSRWNDIEFVVDGSCKSAQHFSCAHPCLARCHLKLNLPKLSRHLFLPIRTAHLVQQTCPGPSSWLPLCWSSAFLRLVSSLIAITSYLFCPYQDYQSFCLTDTQSAKLLGRQHACC